jgi:23S rRNA (adenine2503-C2)-methyltransferase
VTPDLLPLDGLPDPLTAPAPPPPPLQQVDLFALDQEGLAAQLKAWGEPAFRAKQLHKWIHERHAGRFADMTDLPAALRKRLEAEARLGVLEIEAEQRSKDGTRKRLYRLPDGQLIESVLMPYADGRQTACISSQAGCAMACAFCATGQMGFARQLSAAEIAEQAWRFDQELKAEGQRLSNVVLMGMGEPFHNFDAVVSAIGRLNRDIGIGARHITVSTVGLVPQIYAFAELGLQVKLAVSLHSARDEERSALMPINRRWPIRELMAACRHYANRSGRRVSFEWALIAGKNDTVEEATRLGELLAHMRCHVNLIPLNPTGGYAEAPGSPEAAAAFVATLEAMGVPATVRVRRGIDIDAGCGQLKSEVMRRQRAATEATGPTGATGPTVATPTA